MINEMAMKCSCNGDIFRIIGSDTQITAICINCDRELFIVSPTKDNKEKVEEYQLRLISLLKAIYKDDYVKMRKFVADDLGVRKVQDCKDIAKLNNAIYNIAASTL